MCGIALIFNSNGQGVEKEPLQRMVKSLNHRGPDGHGSVIHDHAGLGHTRLSIVDIQGGAQPMYSDDRRWCIVYNGEIYNYQSLRQTLINQGIRFQTRTDTEVVLQLFIKEGPSALHRLRGMFSFIIFDRQSGTVFGARDRIGIKPLYYCQQDGRLLAASEIKALFATGYVEPKLYLPSVRNYFTYQFAITPYTVFENIYELPPGHQFQMDADGRWQMQAYWDLDFPCDGEYESHDESWWQTQFEQALNDSVASHTIGEVPIGSYLSGGIDSAALTWLLTKQYAPQFETFSIHFTNPQQDESPVYRRIASHLKVHNNEIVLHDDRSAGYLDELRQCVYHLEQPQRLAVDIPHYMLSGLVAGKQHKVVYTGDGADELFGGYDCFRQDYMRFSGNQLDPGQDRRTYYQQTFSAYFAGHYLDMLARLHGPETQQQVINTYGCYPAWYDFWQITAELLPDLFTEHAEQAGRNQHMLALAETMKPALDRRHMLNQSLYIEHKTRLPGWILWKSDRLSMAHGVEARVPYMDHKLVEFSARLPPGFKLNGMNEKYLLKQIAMPHLPPADTQYKKRAFYTPIREWFFKGDQRDTVGAYFSRDTLTKTGLFNPDTVERYYEELLAMPAPQTLDEHYRITQLEWILLLVLSVQLLHEQFVEKKAPCFQI